MSTSPNNKSFSCRCWRVAYGILSMDEDDWADLAYLGVWFLMFLGLIEGIRETIPDHKRWHSIGLFFGGAAVIVLVCYVLFKWISMCWRGARRFAFEKVSQCEEPKS